MSEDQRLIELAGLARVLRDDLLIGSDWTHKIEDRPIKDKHLWALYRSKLRDLPERPDFPVVDNNLFPKSPVSTDAEYDKYVYVESRSGSESPWKVNPDWADPQELNTRGGQ